MDQSRRIYRPRSIFLKLRGSTLRLNQNKQSWTRITSEEPKQALRFLLRLPTTTLPKRHKQVVE